MSGQGEAAPVTPPAPVAAAPAASAPSPAAPVAPAPSPAAPAASGAGEPPAWAIDRIDRLSADKKELERQLAEAKGGRPPAPVNPPIPVVPAPAAPAAAPAAFDAAAIERRAQELADTRATQMEFQGKVKSIAEAGLKAHAEDWASTVNRLQLVNAGTPDIINAAVELGNAPEIIYALGKNLDEAARIAGLPPAQQGAALAKFAATKLPDPTAKISKAPAPLGTSVGGGAPSEEFNDKLSPDEWYRRRTEQRKNRRVGA